jgi:ABC-type bacteriocin/lantibiotic exporter with double-glycine peptidase domain
MRIVKQKGDSDCVLAVLSMAVNKPYSQMFKPKFCEAVEAADGCTQDLLKKAFKLAGLVEGENMRSLYTHQLDKHYIAALLWERRAMIQVTSLNYRKGEHFIYWDGKELFDPSNKQVYKFVENLRPTYLWLLKDNYV